MKWLLLQEVSMVPMYYFINFNKSCSYTYVIWQGNEGKIPDNDTFGVETCRSLIIYIYIYYNCAFVG